MCLAPVPMASPLRLFGSLPNNSLLFVVCVCLAAQPHSGSLCLFRLREVAVRKASGWGDLEPFKVLTLAPWLNRLIASYGAYMALAPPLNIVLLVRSPSRPHPVAWPFTTHTIVSTISITNRLAGSV
ncbi:hypothetical protein B0T17DRAFT_98943 [Bombardia bombarda]|uniref:Uncharacterized protein n=1 Tax=Bombardia bombarda TaxID=252184 RepID=A0AA39XN69_9PEZI|nr:hypothetical protein B0T17DRAFT_98943 [Bombardia bombarda]